MRVKFIVTCVFLLHNVSATDVFEGFHDFPFTLDSLNDSHSPSIPPPARTLIKRLKITFLKNLQPEYLHQLQELRESLNQDGLTDSLQSQLERLGEDPPEIFVPGFYTWLLAQPREDVLRWMEDLDEYSSKFESWLDQHVDLEEDDISSDEHEAPWEDNDTLVIDDEQLSLPEFIMVMLGKYITIVQKVGYQNLYRVGELFYSMDKDGDGFWSVKLLTRMISIKTKINRLMTYSRRGQQAALAMHFAKWVLRQDKVFLKKLMGAEDKRLKQLFKSIDEQ